MERRYFPFWLLAITLLIVLPLPLLIQNGMFMDAMLYTSVAHNLSQGIGTFWFPVFSQSGIILGLSTFHEQPPLGFAIMSLFFKIFGSSMYVERFYVLTTLILSTLLILRLWKEACRNFPSLSKLGWLPIIFWITVPPCYWSYSNNMLENTMGIFTLMAILFITRSCQSNRNYIGYSLLVGFCIFLATLTKGVPGFFPIGVPFLYYIITRDNSLQKMIIQSLLIILVPITIYAILWNLPVSGESLRIYVFKRLLFRVGSQPTTGSHFTILYELFLQIFFQLVFTGLVLLLAKVKRMSLNQKLLRLALFFIAIGLSASIPLMLTKVQRGFYLIPALPYFAIGFALLVSPVVVIYINKINPNRLSFKIITSVLVITLFVSIGYTLSKRGLNIRDNNIINDVKEISQVVPHHSNIGADGDIWSNEWSLQCYLMRNHNIGIIPGYQSQYYLHSRFGTDTIPVGYQNLHLNTHNYDLYVKEN